MKNDIYHNQVEQISYSYLELKNRHQQEVNAFPMFFAFDNEAFNKGMESFGLSPDETSKIYKFGSSGGYYLKSDSDRLKEMFDRHERERKEAVANDKTGKGYILQMFKYELANHEYAYTLDTEDTLLALDLTEVEIEASEPLKRGLKLAIKNILKEGVC